MSNGTFTGVLGETISLVFDFTEDLSIKRQENFQYALAEFITIGAFVYECTNAGKTASEAPIFSKTIGDTIDDGSVEWTCRDFSTSGSDTISTRTVTAGSNVTVDSSAIEKSTRVAVVVTLTALGSKETLCQVVTAAGETLKKIADIIVT